jgi:hypothetical protein
MSVYETIGYMWVIFTSTCATVSILYLAWVGLRVVVATRECGNAVVKVLPVTWGGKGRTRSVDVRV